ncbi:cupin domain-containing protein [Calidifontibacillus erzurumensis]|uniref:cupin domain-containing protein n=1 Tax=Calidifontibacillus erzurumensis TaxID=2741433 RepID=UPI0035B56A05
MDEYIFVTKGQIELEIGDELYKFSNGVSIRFLPDKHHCYRNQTDELVHWFILYYFK